MSAAEPPPELRDAYAHAGQSQVFAFWHELGAEDRRMLVEQAREIDLGELGRLARTLLGRTSAPLIDLADLEPAPYEALPDNGGDAVAWAQARAAGEEALRAGRVAAFTVAGGQGTR